MNNRYESRKQSIIESTKQHRLINRELVDSIKQSNNTCPDCGEMYMWYVLEFDHILPSDKLFSIGDIACRNWSPEKIIDEVAKCEIVCTCCHRMRTFENRIDNELRSIVDKLKNKPCLDCNKYYMPYQMDYDHINPNTKINEIARMINKRVSIDEIIAEIEKCELVCANCHKIRTYFRRTT